MPDTDVNKPGQKPSTKPGSGEAALTLEQELDQLLADIELAVEDLDPLGDLEDAAAKAREEAKAGDPEYDETEDLFDVVTVGGEQGEAEDAEQPRVNAQETGAVTEKPSAEPATESIEAPDHTESALDAELDGLIEEVAPTRASQIPVSDAGSARPEEKQTAQISAEQSQIDHELDALLAEANAVLGDDPDEDATEASQIESPEEVAVESATSEAAIESEPTTEAPEPLDEVVEEPQLPEAAAPAQPQTPASSESDDVDVAVETVADVAADVAGAASPESTRSIEDLDADLAARAEEVAAIDSEPTDTTSEQTETDTDAFRSSEDVVEEVIDEHASAVQSTASSASAGDPNDDLAHLMAESPASAQLGVAESPPAAPKMPTPTQSVAAPTSKPAPAGAAAVKTDPAPETAPQPAGGFAKGVITRCAGIFGGLTKHLQPLAMRVARVLSKPLELMPPKVRDDIGWLATVTLFLAIAVMVAYFLFR